VSHDSDDAGLSERPTVVDRPLGSAAVQGSLPPGTILAGRYEVRGTIGRGGMGLVVEAFDRTLGVTVAIKIVRAELAGEREWSERLAREVKLARQIQHPNVCRVFDFAQGDGRAFLIMELATGGTLRDEIRQATAGARLLAERISDARALAAGLAAIHASGIVHRDISPQNALRMGDGRLVLSDFGLATDSFDGSTSIHGGTVAYMAPEILRGGRANVAADVWSLGAVIHEIVFGERLQWNPQTAELRSSVGGRRLTPLERSVFEICRACLAADPARRPRGAEEVAARLSDVGLARSAGRRARRRVALAVAVAGIAVMAIVGAKRIETSRKNAAPAVVAAEAAPADPLLIIPTGEPDDWTDKSKVLAEIPDRVRCMVRLPDRHTVRLVWGYPAHAEDIDTRTGKRSPSPLVPDAYAEGCPDLSADGKRLVYAGHTRDDRAFAFVSAHADGSDAVPAVQIAEPSVDSDPVWLPDGEAFVYDVDDKHSATFSTVTKISLVMPTATESIFTSFHAVLGNRIFALSFRRDSGSTETTGFDYPRLGEVVHWRIPIWAMDLQSANGKTYYSAAAHQGRLALVEIDPFEKRARLVGAIGRQSLRHPKLLEGGLALDSVERIATLVVRSSDQRTRRTRVADDLLIASKCGARIIGTQHRDAAERNVWVDASGRVVGPVESDHAITSFPRCSFDGNIQYYASYGDSPGISRCDVRGCRTIFTPPAGGLALSPDDRRLAFITADSGSRTVRWISSDGSGDTREIAANETACSPVWSTAKDIWVSLRKGREVFWKEIDTDSGRPTGHTALGGRDCTNGIDDPLRPLHDPVEIEIAYRSQLRLLPSKYLPAGSVSR
jgi:hypothetical protein